MGSERETSRWLWFCVLFIVDFWSIQKKNITLKKREKNNGGSWEGVWGFILYRGCCVTFGSTPLSFRLSARILTMRLSLLSNHFHSVSLCVSVCHTAVRLSLSLVPGYCNCNGKSALALSFVLARTHAW